MTHRALSLLCLAVALSASVAAQQPRPVLAGPADVLSGRLRLPAPADVATTSGAALLPVTFDGSGTFRVALPVEADGRLTIVPLSPEAEAWRLTLAEPGGALRPLDAWVASGRAEARTRTLAALPGATARSYTLDTAAEGSWELVVRHRPGAPEGLLAVHTGGALRLTSHVRDWRLSADRRVGLTAFAAPEGGGMLHSVSARVRLDGAEQRVALHDDGLHADGAAGDGVFGGELPPLAPGAVQVVVEARGVGAAGRPALRTSWHLLPVAAPGATLDGTVVATAHDAEWLSLALGLARTDGPRRLQVSAELWGRDADGGAHPLAWASRLVGPDEPAELLVHAGLLAGPGGQGPLELRRVRIQDVDSHVLLSAAETLPVDERGRPPLARRTADASVPLAPPGVPSPLALAGPGGARVTGGPQPEAWQRGLALVHGYCSGGVWPLGHFSGELLDFADLDQNRSHDAFARLLAAQTEAAGLDSFGVVAHSQGGSAALHLLTYYASGLDRAVGGRRIQSVGTPYQGTPLAGALAGLGQVFGAGCGENTDLAPEGAALWLAGIPTWAREEVHYWTTQEDGGSCEFITSLFLSDPEDGTTEKDRGQLPGAVDEGHVIGWCHTTGMSDPAQYTDAVLNAERDATAAR